MLLDLRKGWTTYDAAYRAEADPRRRAILAVMKDHLKWEVLGQPDRILETVSPEAVYRFYGLGQTVEYRGLDEIRGFYQSLADSGANVLQLDIEHLAVSDWGLAAHGVWHQPYAGADLVGPWGPRPARVGRRPVRHLPGEPAAARLLDTPCVPVS